MLRISRLRGLPHALTIVVIAAGMAAISGEADAKSRTKKRYDDATIESSQRLPQVAMPPVRFFTINDVLAKREGKRIDGASLASLNKVGVVSDAAPASASPK